LQFDFVGVSGTNQYKVKPLALVTTAAPLIVVVLRAALVDAVLDGAADADGADEPLEAAGCDDDEELPHPAASSATSVIATAAQHLRVRWVGGRSVSLLTLCANVTASSIGP
jgi:hypothetical protein